MDCSICKKPFEVNPLSGEQTCFVHGNPDSAWEIERDIYRVWLERHTAHAEAQLAIENEE